MNYLSKFHTYIVIIILVLSVSLIGMGIQETYIDYYPIKSSETPFSQVFNIDNQINIQDNNQHNPIQWKTFWRKNYSNFDKSLDDLFKNKSFEYNPRTRLLYDGVRNVKSNCI